jgi:D-arabinose 1-dehydrogenase
MPTPKTPLSTILPPLICGTATFNTQYNPDPLALPIPALISRALALNINAFDTSPYYGPSEVLLGHALSTLSPPAPRESYLLLTKVGRIAPTEFDYSPAWIRKSIARSLERLHTDYLDVVYCHDVEFVTPEEVLGAVKELRRLRDEEGSLKWVGICGYPIPVLCSLAELVLKETGEPLDIVQSYANFTLQNSTLETEGLERLHKAGVSVIPNASMLGMGLLRGVGVPGDWHPAPKQLRGKMQEVAEFLKGKEEKLEVVAIRWALDRWARVGAAKEGGLGISVAGVSNLAELEETARVWRGVLDGLQCSEADKNVAEEQRNSSIARRLEVEELTKAIREILGEWRDYAWASPDEGFVNTRVAEEKVEVS